MPTLNTLMPNSAARRASIPISASACMTLTCALPVVTMPSRGDGAESTTRFSRFARANASAAGSL